jgi:hypothetical protein
MKKLSWLISLLCLTNACAPKDKPVAPRDTRVFEMRTYYATPGKLDAVVARFRNHTVKLFEKNGMTNIGYWVPVENTDNKLVYMLAFPSREARDASFKAFGSSPEWKAVVKETEANGKIVAKIESVFLQATDFSPAIKTGDAGPRLFELREYTASPGNLDNLLARFRDHTVNLFKKHGMTQIGYWTQIGVDNKLVYILAHKDADAAQASFTAFRADPDWIAAKKASEDKAGSPLTVQPQPVGVKSTMMKATDFSPIR